MLVFALKRSTALRPSTWSACRPAALLQVDRSLSTIASTQDSGYERKTPHEHVLLRPGMYVGQMESSLTDTWIYDAAAQSMCKRSVNYSPALLKIFDEILVNAADNLNRGDPTKISNGPGERMSRIDIGITSSTDVGSDGQEHRRLFIKVSNDGQTIPIHVHRCVVIFPRFIFILLFLCFSACSS
jgi:DNA topoisomerase-2